MKNREEFHELRSLLDRLKREGLVLSDDSGHVRYGSRQTRGRAAANKRIGTLSVTKRGDGIVRVKDPDEEIRIAPANMKTALHGDIVAVAPFARSLRSRRGSTGNIPEGEIVEIVKRTITEVTGRLEQGRNFFFVVPDDPRISRDIYVAREDAGRAKQGDKVVVRLLPWEDEHLNPEGTIVEVLGPSGDARVEVLSVARSFRLRVSFPPAVLKEAEQCTSVLSQHDLSSRIDLRGTACFTIDPEDAKDFDDALSCEMLGDGSVLLGVHIADVSHYVKDGTALDAEAFARGTSVYMVNEVVPMLPERLSNDVCSLVPDADRLTFSVLMDVDREGTINRYTIGKSVIRSVRRFTYKEAQEILDRKRGRYSDELTRLFAVTGVLHKRRRKSGSIDFDTAEVKFTFDRSGLPSRIIKKERLDTHEIVEESMLLANKTVAEHIGRRQKGPYPFVYRVHDQPDPSRLEDLGRFVRQFGYSLDVRSGVSARALQRLLDQVQGSDVETLINEVALRSMAKAVYAERNIGHYGLAFKYYTHFTSPIRRYPDLVVHRLLHEYEKGATVRRQGEIADDLPEICRQASERERVAQDAERASVKVMQVEYMKRHLGDEFDGVIGGVTGFGMFVEINDLLVEGFVGIRGLVDDEYVYDEKHYALKGRSRGRVYRLGDSVRVRVTAVKPVEREIDFDIVE